MFELACAQYQCPILPLFFVAVSILRERASPKTINLELGTLRRPASVRKVAFAFLPRSWHRNAGAITDTPLQGELGRGAQPGRPATVPLRVSKPQRLDQCTECGGMLAPARVVQEKPREKRRAPVLEYPHQRAVCEVWRRLLF